MIYITEDDQRSANSVEEEDTTKFIPLIPLKISSIDVLSRGKFSEYFCGDNSKYSFLSKRKSFLIFWEIFPGSRYGIVGGGGINDSPLEVIETEEHPFSSMNAVPSNLHATFGGLTKIKGLLRNPSNFGK